MGEDVFAGGAIGIRDEVEGGGKEEEQDDEQWCADAHYHRGTHIDEAAHFLGAQFYVVMEGRSGVFHIREWVMCRVRAGFSQGCSRHHAGR